LGQYPASGGAADRFSKLLRRQRNDAAEARHEVAALDMEAVEGKVREPGITGGVRVARQEKLPGIRAVLAQDAALLLDWLPSRSIARIDLLFPDPWPKKRHWKRRFVRPANLARIARVLVPGGEFRFATDVESYAEWTREEVAKHGGLKGLRDSAEPWDDWPGTRYEAKAERAGRAASYISFVKS
jgi:tRNA (guanine-N7-)-methyltransferase